MATIDAGSTSVHLLVADVAVPVAAGAAPGAGPAVVRPIADESVLLGLGPRVDATGTIAGRARADLVVALRYFTDLAARCGARRVAIVGTEPFRRAADAAEVLEVVAARTGRPLRVLSHDEEGLLTLLGVTGGARSAGEVAVIDVGGGSSELVIAEPGRAVRAIGLRLGAARLTASFAASDPPSDGEVAAMREEADRLLAQAPDERPARLVAVGGTVSNVLKLVPEASDRVLDGDRLERALTAAVAAPAAVISERHLVRPERARILPAGIVIVGAILRRYGLPSLVVSGAGIREGLAVALAIAGDDWPQRLEGLVAG